MTLWESIYPSESTPVFAFLLTLVFCATKLPCCTKAVPGTELHLLFLIPKPVSAFSHETSARLRIVQNIHAFVLGNLEPDGFLFNSQTED